MNCATHRKQLTSYGCTRHKQNEPGKVFYFFSLHTEFKQPLFFSKSTVRNYLCPQGVVVGSKQISRQICTMSNSQINPQYYNITFKLGKGIKRSIHRKKTSSTYNEGVIEGCKDVSNTKDRLSFTDSGSKGNVLLLGLPGLPPRLQTYMTIRLD